MNLTSNLKAALSNGGAVVAIAAAAIGAVAGEQAEPVDRGAGVVEDVGQAAGVVAETPGLCPEERGWDDTSVTVDHAVFISCSLNIDGDRTPEGEEDYDWIVVLRPDGSFDNAVELDTPGAETIYDPAEVPQWLP